MTIHHSVSSSFPSLYGIFITFMPKPTIGDWRSGAHMNTSVQRLDQPGVPLNEDLYEMTDQAIAASGAQRLPLHLLEATEILRDDRLAKHVLGDQMLESYVRYKVDEWERYHQQVSDWEVEEYLRLY